jgi:hypothetical protein
MDEGQKVYVATHGEYDNYEVVGVFLREQDAKDCELADDYFEETLRTGPMDVRTRYRAIKIARGPHKGTFRYSSWEAEYDGDDRVKVDHNGAEGWDQGKVRAIAAGELSPFEN